MWVAVVDVPEPGGDGSGPGGDGPADLGDRPADPGADEPADVGGTVYLAPLPDGPVTVLTGASAVLYRALLSEEDPVARVARDLGVPTEEVDPEAVREFAEELREGGFIAPRTRDC